MTQNTRQGSNNRVVTDKLNELVSYRVNAENSVYRTRQSKDEEWISVKDFGAQGDGQTDDTQYIQSAIDFCSANGVKELLVPKGTYLVTTLSIKTDVTLKGEGHNKTILESNNYPIIECTSTCGNSGVVGVWLKSLLNDSTDHNKALLDVNNGAYIDGFVIDSCRFSSLTTGLNGILFKVSEGINRSVALGRARNIEIKNNEFQTGRMGIEFVNHSSQGTITNITIGVDATVTANNFYAAEGMMIKLHSITGTGAVDGLNNDYFKAYNVSGEGDSITFQLQKSDGTLVATTGGTYSSGGYTEEFRYEHIYIDNNRFSQTGNVVYGMGISLSGYGSACSITNNVFYDNPTYSVEFNGCSFSHVSKNTFINVTGDIFSTSGTRECDGNIISGNSCLGFSKGRCYIYSQTNLVFSDNILLVGSQLDIGTTNSVYSNNIIRTKGNYAAIIDNVGGNIIQGGIYDNSRSSDNYSCVRFYGAGAIGNIAKDITILKGTGGVNYDEDSGAADNHVFNYRLSHSSIFTRNVEAALTAETTTSNIGDMSDATTVHVSNTKHLSQFAKGTGWSALRLKHNTSTATDYIPTCHFRISWSGRQNNTSRGGMVFIAMNSFNDYDATPVFDFIGDTVTLATVAYDVSGYPYWDIQFPSNNANLFIEINGLIEDSEASKISFSYVA